MTRTPSFWQRARLHPDRVAVIDPQGSAWSAGSILRRSDAIAARLQDLGVRERDAVAVAASNHLDALCVAMAVTQIGGYFVPVSNRSTAPEIEYVLDNCGSDVFFAEPAVLDRAASAGLSPDHLVAFGGDTPNGHVSMDDFVAAAGTPVPTWRRCGQVMPYTSGTTGRPKGVRRPLPSADPDEYWGATADSTLTMLRLDGGDDDVHLVVSPLYHTAIITLATAAMHAGQLVVLRERFEPLDVLETIERHRVTNAHMVPTQFHRLLAVDESVRDGFDLSSVRTLLHGAAPCPVGVKQRMIEWLGPVICEYYGASEGGGTFVDAEDWLANPGTVGRPYPGAEVHILDDDQTPLPPGQVGRVFLRPSGDLFEYHGDPEKTAASRAGGLITAGDLGYVDEHGYLFLSGRANDLVITGGVNVYPAEVEDALFSHPAIADAAVIGLPDDEWGEIVTAIVELASGWSADETTRSAILAHCGERLAGFKVPKRVDFVHSLPREPSGKIRKSLLLATYGDTATS